jgi:hypothetical protein
MAKDEIVEHHDAFALREQMLDCVRADVAGTAGDEKGTWGHVCGTCNAAVLLGSSKGIFKNETEVA